MEEIKVGDYIRTKYGYIGKILKIKKSKRECDNYYITDKTMASGFYEHIAKHSKQLKELIKVGDIVKIRTRSFPDFIEFIRDEYDISFLEEQLIKGLWTIKEILTKEMYEVNCYKVGGEDE